MSGIAEASLVLGLISSIISIVEAGLKVSEAIDDAKGLHKSFQATSGNLPLILNTLRTIAKVQEQADQERNNTNDLSRKQELDEASKAIEPTIKDCKKIAEELKEVLDKLSPGVQPSRSRRFTRAIHTVVPGRERKVQELERRLYDKLHLLHQNRFFADRVAPVPFQSVKTSCLSIPFRRDGDFIGRGDLITRIEQKVSAPAARLALVGLGGVGKSQLAIECAYRHHDQHPDCWVLWIHVSNRARFEQSVRDVAHLIHLPGREDAKTDVLKAFRDWLQNKQNGRWLVILDNADDLNFLAAADTLLRSPEVHTAALCDMSPHEMNVSAPAHIAAADTHLQPPRTHTAASQTAVSPEIRASAGMYSAASSAEVSAGSRSAASKHALSDYLPICDHGSVLITTRSKQVASNLVVDSETLFIDPMNETEALELLHKKLQAQEAGKQHDQTLCRQLVAALDLIPLAITQAAAYIRYSSRCSIQSYLDKITRNNKSTMSVLNRAKAGEAELRRDRDATNSVILTWQVSFEHIVAIRKSAADLLSLMCYCDRQAIPESLLRCSKVKDRKESNPQPGCNQTEDVDGENEQSYNLSDNTSDEDALPVDESVDETDEEFEEDLSMLESYSFISTAVEGTTFEMHRLVQLATRAWLEMRGQDEGWRQQFVQNLDQVLPKGDYEKWAECQMLYPHAKAAVELKPSKRKALLQWSSIMYKVAWYADGIGATTESIDMAMMSLEVRERLLGGRDPDSLKSMVILAMARREAGEWDDSEILSLKLLQMAKEVLGETHEDTLFSMATLASTYGEQGRHDEAENLELDVLEKTKTVMGETHPDTLTSMGNLALTYSKQGRYDEAVRLELKVLEKRRAAFGETHSDTLTSKGGTMRRRRLQLEVLEKGKAVFGETHPRTFTSMNSLAFTYGKQGRYDEAEKLELKVLEKRRAAFGETHSDTLTSMNNLAVTYSRQGRHDEAERLQLEVLEKCKAVLGETHHSTLLSMANLSLTLWHLGRRQSSLDLMASSAALSRTTLGADHPDTIDRCRWKQEMEEGLEAGKVRTRRTWRARLGSETTGDRRMTMRIRAKARVRFGLNF